MNNKIIKRIISWQKLSFCSNIRPQPKKRKWNNKQKRSLKVNTYSLERRERRGEIDQTDTGDSTNTFSLLLLNCFRCSIWCYLCQYLSYKYINYHIYFQCSFFYFSYCNYLKINVYYCDWLHWVSNHSIGIK